MHQPAVALTNYALALENLAFALVLALGLAAGAGVRPWLVAMFASLALVALLGGVVHGYHPDETTPAHQLLWRGTLLGTGVVALTAWMTVAAVLWPDRLALGLVAVLVQFSAYGAYAVLFDSRYRVATVNLAPPFVALLALLVVRFRQTGDAVWLCGVSGLALAFVGSLTQQAGIGIHPRHFDHNALYHVIQGVALALFFVTARRLALG